MYSFAIVRKNINNFILSLLVFTSTFLFFVAVDSTEAQNISSYEYSSAGINRSIIPVSYVAEVDLSNHLKTGSVGEISFEDPSGMRSYYRGRKNETFWTGDIAKLDTARDTLLLLEDSWTHGLNPDNYHVEYIRNAISNISPMKNSDLELLLSDAVIKYGQDLTGMRISAGVIGQKEEYWKQKLSGTEIFNLIRTYGDVRNALETLPPKTALYKSLRNELISLNKEFYKQGGDTDIEKISYSGILRPGYSHRAVPKIRERLGLAPTNHGAKYIYDDKLALVVMDFQKKNDLNQDGVIGHETLKILNRSVKDRITQVTANMERLRWMERKRPNRYIVVNIPSMTLWAIDEGEVKLEMPVVVGQKARKTQSFVTEVTGVRINPTWTVPFSIKRADFLPKLRKNSSYLADKGIEIFKGRGRNRITIDGTAIDWDVISMKELRDLRMVQTPGDHNALGRVRILMPNIYNIYLHDTNHKELFARNDRFISSGCIRLSDPEAVADFVMNKNDDWSLDKMSAIKETVKMTDLKSDGTMPVYILYQSVWTDSAGKLIFGRDVYGSDKKLYQALEARNEVRAPKAPEVNLELSYSVYR